MATIIDPSGTISVVYRDPGVTVYPVTASGEYDNNPDPPHGSDATALSVFSAVNVVLVTVTATDYGVKLPDAEVGDYFEIYRVSGSASVYVYDYAGNLIGTSSGWHGRFDGTNWRS